MNRSSIQNSFDSLCIIPKKDRPLHKEIRMLITFSHHHFSEQLKKIQKRVLELDHFQIWVHCTKLRIMRPNAMNKYGAVLDDFGLEIMLGRFMSGFIRPIYLEFSILNLVVSHRGFVVEYGMNRDVELGRII
ncbi:putative PKHD-type hydroxylase, partial [Mucuna pruriens]